MKDELSHFLFILHPSFPILSKSLFDPFADLSDRMIQTIIDDDMIEFIHSLQLTSSCGQTSSDAFGSFPALPQAPFIFLPRGGPHEKRQTIGILGTNLGSSLYIDVQENSDALRPIILHFAS